MRLIDHAAGQRDVAQRIIAHQHQMTRFLDSPPQDVEMRTDTEGILEGPREVGLAALHDGAQVRDDDSPAEVRIDIVAHPPNLPTPVPASA